ncbi:lytic polysaccharide monooxygenase [Carnobacterium divergens]|uniref:Chitin-binding protein n=1 Tax=Carnobacterium divergens TaxID=2748 RepID=A0A7Z8CZB5_CARDV|nr:lytic polysaccharide monooxygenase [Carnobacterium divergens]TFI73967.1 chitin-binding protein [Carnobacterium divergens]TFI77937.1 chitin-binding protein [Carnobacterium divergens]TFI84778.1 chitin-binding protein [Carnobacterium divergens]TFI96817.1 chitin-binding protein [Carnobacterium divergens]TFJ12764.1 chitin-binding protein [Carnobacterium divergens]
MKLMKPFMLAATIGVGLVAFNQQSFAHGYILQPESRAYKGTAAGGNLNKEVGRAQWEPQSIESFKGFPNASNSPQDGKIASAGVSGFEPMDVQNMNWHKTDIQTGKLDITWNLTAPHSTHSWNYFITKQGWNPNEPLKRENLEKISTKEDFGLIPEKIVTQQITIPANRTGYHVIVGTWDISDTLNAFYQVIDVNINNGPVEEDKEAPTIPTELKTTHTAFNQVNLSWKASTDNIGVSNYEVLRDGKVIGSTKGTTFEDKNVTEKTTYRYEIRALDAAGNVSKNSTILTVATPEKPKEDNEKPSSPDGLMAHMTTATSTMLHWNASTDNVAVAGYEIYRDGKSIKITTDLMYTDKELKENTTYSYNIVAFDAAGNRSANSKTILVTTKEQEKPDPSTTWNPNTVYLYNETVTYNGLEYKARWWTQDEQPDISEVWELITPNASVNWNSSKAYTSGDKVTYQGKHYIAKWWSQTTPPNETDSWMLEK